MNDDKASIRQSFSQLKRLFKVNHIMNDRYINFLFLLTIASIISVTSGEKRPHIILIVADDLGMY
jgi:hypothetical protein